MFNSAGITTLQLAWSLTSRPQNTYLYKLGLTGSKFDGWGGDTARPIMAGGSASLLEGPAVWAATQSSLGECLLWAVSDATMNQDVSPQGSQKVGGMKSCPTPLAGPAPLNQGRAGQLCGNSKLHQASSNTHDPASSPSKTSHTSNTEQHGDAF